MHRLLSLTASSLSHQEEVEIAKKKVDQLQHLLLLLQDLSPDIDLPLDCQGQ